MMKAIDPSPRSAAWIRCAAFLLILPACSGEKTPARDASSAPAGAGEQQGASSASRDGEATVQISKAFRVRCQLPESTQQAPRFQFDQATLRPLGENVLDDVARCLIEGPLKGEVITIIGRADARGSHDYNQDLAASRAAAARNYLAQRGVPADRMRLLTRGEQGARGDDEATWAIDRRVDLELGDLNNSPILEGSMIQAESSESRKEKDGASYSDTAEGGKAVGGTGKGASPAP